ncbi:4-oxalocrotonate tautomerase family protein [Sulfitobacter sp. R86518]|uniref:tautomerase family protein n=1 Tax=Sulfitobacter sp. R86518 TaxID=3093858 RepID=UPI0036D7CEF4
MPNIIVKSPAGSLTPEIKSVLAQKLTKVASDAEQIGNDPRQQFLTWVVFEEWADGAVFAGGVNPLSKVTPVIVFIYPPVGVLDQGAQAGFGNAVHAALSEIVVDGSPVATSVIFCPVPDGDWCANGQVWKLPEHAKSAGYKHLQHLVGS